MRPDVSELWDFYSGRPGRVARQRLARRVRSLWPNLKGLSVLGLGYAIPYLGQFEAEAERVIALMPASQGVMHWPKGGGEGAGHRGLVALSEDYDLPLADNSVDRILLVHELEHAGEARLLLREVWRILKSGGRVLIVAPNRTSLWALMERTPFGHGYPYSKSQLSRLLRDNMFQPLRRSGALYMPPWRSRLLLRAGSPVEQIGVRWGIGMAGVLVVEADKQIYAATTVQGKVRARARAAALTSNGSAPRQANLPEQRF